MEVCILIEEWRDIEGYEGLYQISNLGRVKSLSRIAIDRRGIPHYVNERILKQAFDKNGYCLVGLHINGKIKSGKVHRLVASAFIDNPHNLPDVNHKDENKSNNNVDNLEWCTPKYNINYGTCLDRIAKTIVETEVNKGGRNGNARKIICDNTTFNCIKDCAEFYDINYSTMKNWLQKKRITPKRFADMGLRYAD